MKTQFITNDSGKKLAVILPISKYRKMLEELEELDDIKAYDESKKDKEPSIPIDEAFEMIEKKIKVLILPLIILSSNLNPLLSI